MKNLEEMKTALEKYEEVERNLMGELNDDFPYKRYAEAVLRDKASDINWRKSQARDEKRVLEGWNKMYGVGRPVMSEELNLSRANSSKFVNEEIIEEHVSNLEHQIKEQREIALLISQNLGMNEAYSEVLSEEKIRGNKFSKYPDYVEIANCFVEKKILEINKELKHIDVVFNTNTGENNLNQVILIFDYEIVKKIGKHFRLDSSKINLSEFYNLKAYKENLLHLTHVDIIGELENYVKNAEKYSIDLAEISNKIETLEKRFLFKKTNFLRDKKSDLQYEKGELAQKFYNEKITADKIREIINFNSNVEESLNIEKAIYAEVDKLFNFLKEELLLNVEI